MIRLEKLPYDILSKIQDAQKLLAQDNNVVFAYLFGGLAKKEMRPLSDVDIAVYVKETGSLAAYKLELFDRLTDALGTSELDLIILNTAPVSIAGRILKNREILVDREPFRRHLYESAALREFFDFEIKEFSGMTVDGYRGDWKAQRIIERTLQMMIETCVDIANHIVSDKGMRAPSSYADTFKVLFENKIIGGELHAIMEKMAKFRNVVAHQYEQVDAEIVVIILTKHLGDFERYKDAVLAYLKRYV
jgi:uncharacterized protein YutE (UPF0331/DUF86 family)/predicted nucleotidyltransferase